MVDMGGGVLFSRTFIFLFDIPGTNYSQSLLVTRTVDRNGKTFTSVHISDRMPLYLRAVKMYNFRIRKLENHLPP